MVSSPAFAAHPPASQPGTSLVAQAALRTHVCLFQHALSAQVPSSSAILPFCNPSLHERGDSAMWSAEPVSAGCTHKKTGNFRPRHDETSFPIWHSCFILSFFSKAVSPSGEQRLQKQQSLCLYGEHNFNQRKGTWCVFKFWANNGCCTL